MTTRLINRAETVLFGALREAIPDGRWPVARAMPFFDDFASAEAPPDR